MQEDNAAELFATVLQLLDAFIIFSCASEANMLGKQMHEYCNQVLLVSGLALCLVTGCFLDLLSCLALLVSCLKMGKRGPLQAYADK